MEPLSLAVTQSGLRDRVEEIRTRLAAATEGNVQAKDAQQQKVLDRMKIAVPLIGDASTAMDRAHMALVDKKLKDAASSERDAIVALSKAIEQFADLKQTIDLAAESQHQVVVKMTVVFELEREVDWCISHHSRMRGRLVLARLRPERGDEDRDGRHGGPDLVGRLELRPLPERRCDAAPLVAKGLLEAHHSMIGRTSTAPPRRAAGTRAASAIAASRSSAS